MSGPAGTVTLRIPTPLRRLVGGADELRAAGATVREVLEAADREHDGLMESVLGPDGELRSFVNVFLGSRNVRSLQRLDTPVHDGDVLSILPAVAGGATRAAGATRGDAP